MTFCIKTIITIVLASFSICVNAQNFRVSYSFLRKNDNADEKYVAEMDMKLDIGSRKTVFYSETTFLKDSLNLLAFDANGSIINDEEYKKRCAIYGGTTSEIAFIDYRTEKISTGWQCPGIFIIGTSSLEQPLWETTGETKTTLKGYAAKKAEAEFMGRKWIIWYSEDLPLPYGPWLLWGAPGLIIKAQDSEGIFDFTFLGIESIGETSRYDFLQDYYKGKTCSGKRRYYDYSLEEAEKLHTRIMTDIDFQDKMLGFTSAGYIENKNGTISEIKLNPYIPIIPNVRWKNR